MIDYRGPSPQAGISHLKSSFSRAASRDARSREPIGHQGQIGSLVVAADRVAGAERGPGTGQEVGAAADFEAFVGPVFDAGP